MKTRRAHIFFVASAVSLAVIVGCWMFSGPTLPEFSEVRARWTPSDAQLLDRNGDSLDEIRIDRHGRRLEWTALRDISPALKNVVIESEDHRFETHHGVDFLALAAAIARATGAHPRGASTITMQLVSMIDPELRRTGHRRSALQKFAQIKAAFAIERRWTKDQIFESYLNMVTWRGELQGIGAASRVMFGRAPHGINPAEAIVLASLLRAPNANRVAVARRSQKLRSEIIGAPTEGEVASAIEVAFARNLQWNAPLALAPHLAERLMPPGAAEVQCTIDRDLQRFSSDQLYHQVEQVRDRNADDGAVLVAENSTGEVWAYVGGVGDISRAPYVDGVRALRQPGSALKPFLYALAIDRRLLTPASILDDSPLELPEQRGLYRPLDYDRHFRGLVSMRTALASSLNIPAVRTADLVGVEQFAEHLRMLGFEGVSEAGDFYGSSIALGSADVTLWQIVNAYRTLANSGEWSPLRVKPSNINADCKRIYGAETAFLISDILSDRASRSGTFGLENSLATSFWSAVKTGTSKDMRDNWCVGYTRKFTVGVWVGNSRGLSMRDITGMTGAAPVWLEVVSYLHRRFGDGSDIARPARLIESRVEFPNSIESPREELFLAGTEPGAAMRIDSTRPRIVSPADGTIVAFDPDLPEQRQRMSFETSRNAAELRWALDGVALGAANAPQLWAPVAGTHRLALIDKSRRPIDSVRFEVRGSRATPGLEAQAQ